MLSCSNVFAGAPNRWSIRTKRGVSGLLALSLAIGGTTAAGLVGAASASNLKAKNYFRGKTVTILVPNAPGGNIDVTARVAAPYLQSALGAAAVKVIDVTGAGGITGLDQLWNDPRNGLTIGYTNVPVALLTSLVGGSGISYNAGEFTYLGRLTASPRVVVASLQSGITKPSQLRGRRVTIPLSGFDDTFYTVVALSHTLGFKPRYVSGFASQAAVIDSLGSGATDLTEGSLTALLPAIQSHLVRPVMFETSARVPGSYSGMPTWPGLSGTSNSGLVKAFSDLVSIEGSFFVPPHTSTTAVTSIRAAVSKMFREKAFKRAESKAGASLDYLDGLDEQSQIGAVVKGLVTYLPLLRAARKAASS